MNTLLKPFYAVVPLSLEELFAEELKKLGIEKFRLEKGGCWFGAEMSQMMQVNLWTRYASRILLKVAEGPYRTEEDIYKLAKSFRWEQYFTPKNTFKIELSSRRSPLKSVAFTALRVKDAVCDYFRETDGQRPDVEKHDPDIRIYVHLTDKSCIIYLDTSGESLFKRGWREAKGEAPLKENLAAGLLGLAGWTPDKPLQDPFCGSLKLPRSPAIWLPGLIAASALSASADLIPRLGSASRKKLVWR